MSPFGTILAKRIHREGHDGQRLQAERAACGSLIAQRAGHQAPIAPARMRHAKAAHEMMGGMGLVQKLVRQSRPERFWHSGKPPRPSQEIIQKARAHDLSPVSWTAPGLRQSGPRPAPH